MRSSPRCICLAVALVTLAACDDLPDASSSRVLEVRCDTEFDADKLCRKPERLGSELGIRVNAHTQKVQISILKNDGNWFIKDFILEDCSIVDTSNWKCKRHDGQVVEEHSMVRGRYYRSLTGGGPTEFYTSSISGFTFWALHYGFITLPNALRATGYSAPVVSAFGKNA
jgi:hypothetical protein